MQKMIFVSLSFFLLTLPLYASSSFQLKDPPEIQKVEVVNFAKTQEVFGNVSVSGRLSHSVMDRRERIVVTPTSPRVTSSMYSVGILEADGFTSVTISLQGELKSSAYKPGTVGVILVPDESSIMRAFTDDGAILLPLEVKSDVSQTLFPFFTSKTERFDIGFPRYRIFAYNYSATSVEMNIYSYLTN